MNKAIFNLYSIGHSTHSQNRFYSLLRKADVNAIVDVRSSPFSRYNPHFSQRELKQWLKREGVSYVFMGNELGGRPTDVSMFRNGVADYDAMATTDAFSRGLDRLVEGARSHRIAMMCSEHDPLDCHRCLLVARRLAERGFTIGHIMADGEISSHEQMEERLLKLEGLGSEDFFIPRHERLANAYRQRNVKVAYSEALSSAPAG